MAEQVHLVAEADQLAAELRDARCCDALDPCRRCLARRRGVVARRYVLRVPQQRNGGPAEES